MEERRKTQRQRICVPIAVWIHEPEMFDGVTRDISTSGAYILASRPAKIGDLLIFLMRFPAAQSDQTEMLLWAYCKAVRVEPNQTELSFTTGIAAVALEYSVSLHESTVTRLAAHAA